jgi:BirA family biotin operon repressor/biotin-[acetyl-CoA-carboxylase] ligase
LTAADPRNWIASAEVDSTSSLARRYLARCRSAGVSPVPPCAFVAWRQTQGRGRQGRSWSSPAGLGLYVSFVSSDLAPAKVRQLPMAVASLVARTLAAAGLEPRIKWPNDILCRGRKLAGVLLEASSRSGGASEAVVGIGINVHQVDDNLPMPGATSLALEGAPGQDMARLAVEIGAGIRAFEQSGVSLAEVVREYRTWSQHEAGERLRCRQGRDFVEGEFGGFDEDGSLLLEVEGRTVRLAASEIVES